MRMTGSVAIFLIVFGCSIVAFCCAMFQFLKKNKEDIDVWLVGAFCMASCLTGMGNALLLMAQSKSHAWIFRDMTVIGSYCYEMMALNLLVHYMEIERKWSRLLYIPVLVGIFVAVGACNPKLAVYHYDELNQCMRYALRPTPMVITHVLFVALLGGVILFCSIYQFRHAKINADRRFAIAAAIISSITILLWLVNMFQLLFGHIMIPQSSIPQFFGLFLVYYHYRRREDSRINLKNISQYIYSTLSTPMMVYDDRGRLRIVNDEAKEFFAISNQMIGSSAAAPNKLVDGIMEEWLEFPPGTVHKSLEGVCKSNGHECAVTVDLVQNQSKDTIGYLVVVYDVSKRARMIEQLEEERRLAEVANLTKTVFLTNMSHEIRTPMNAVVGFAELMLTLDLDEDAREYAGQIRNSSNNLLAVINDILDVARLESGRAEVAEEEFYVARVFRDIYNMFHDLAVEKSLSLEIDLDPEIPQKLLGDKVRLRGIMSTLLNYSLQYTEEGNVGLRVKVLSKNDETVTLEIRVTDTGNGIPEEEKAHLFDNFAHVDRRLHTGVEGTGLGLSVTKGFVDLMGGTIEVDSVIGLGTAFTVVLSQKVLDKQGIGDIELGKKARESLSNISDLKIRNTRVLVVDDSNINLRVAKRSFENYGMAVDIAADGPTAIELCNENDYDIVFMDQMMPGMSGIEAMKLIREIGGCYSEGGTCKIIVLTANTVGGVRSELMEEGFDEYLGKPMNYQQVERLLLHFLPKERFIGNRVNV